jgi:hypothetical protein
MPLTGKSHEGTVLFGGDASFVHIPTSGHGYAIVVFAMTEKEGSF